MAEIGGFTSDWRHGTAGAPTVLTDFSSKTMSVNMDEENEEKEFQVFNTSSRQYVSSYSNGTIECQYIYDATIRGQLAAIKNAKVAVDFQLSPIGTASGDPLSSGSMILTKLGNPVEAGEIIIMDASWRITGEVTDDTHP